MNSLGRDVPTGASPPRWAGADPSPPPQYPANPNPYTLHAWRKAWGAYWGPLVGDNTRRAVAAYDAISERR